MPSSQCPHPASAIVIVTPMFVLLSFEGYDPAAGPSGHPFAPERVTGCLSDDDAESFSGVPEM